MTTYILSYTMYLPNFGLKAEDYGIKTPVPIRFGKNKPIQAKSIPHAQSLLKANLQERFGKENEIVIDSCVSEAAHKISQRALKNLLSKQKS